MTITIGLLVLILVGLALYFIGTAKFSEVGRIIFFCVLLAFLLTSGHTIGTLRLGR